MLVFSFVGTVTQQVVVDNRRQINVLLAGDGRHSHHSGGSKTAEGRRTRSMKLFFMDCQLYFYKFNPPVSKPIRKLTSFATFLNITMMRFCLLIATLLFCTAATAQRYDASAIFAHNDYARAVPFYEAYDLEVGYIEADVFLVDSKILVAHDKHEIRPERDLETLYLIPLLQKVRQNHGHVYDDHARTLTLMIDLKTEGTPTLRALVNLLEEYPELISNRTLHFMISGSVPDPDTWDGYPSYITFDGRPAIAYTPSQLDRIRMISTSFTQHVQWDGRERMSRKARKKIRALMDEAHAKKKPFRFWATPDFEEAWKELMRLKMDVIVTDDVAALARIIDGQD